MEALGNSMQEVLPSLKFTTEVGEGEEEWLATLDTMLRVENTNQVSYRHYEKPSCTNVMVQRRSALEENSKNQILANDLVRRLGNNDVRQEKEVLVEVVNKFSKKLMTSGYSLSQARRVVSNGVRGWERKKRRAKNEKRNLFRTAKDSMSGRIRKKTTLKTNWYRKMEAQKEYGRQACPAPHQQTIIILHQQ